MEKVLTPEEEYVLRLFNNASPEAKMEAVRLLKQEEQVSDSLDEHC